MDHPQRRVGVKGLPYPLDQRDNPCILEINGQISMKFSVDIQSPQSKDRCVFVYPLIFPLATPSSSQFHFYCWNINIYVHAPQILSNKDILSAFLQPSSHEVAYKWLTFRFFLSTLTLSKRGELIDCQFYWPNGLFLIFNFFRDEIDLALFSLMAVSLVEKTAEPIRALKARLRKRASSNPEK